MEKNKTDMGTDDTYMTLNTHGTYQILAPYKENMYTDNKRPHTNNVGSVSLCSPPEMLHQRAVR